jgi:hypothetical protein
MGRPSDPGMRDPTDKDIHTRQGRDPYPEPRKGAEKGRNPSDDTVDPGDADAEAPHDRGTVQDGNWMSGIDDAEKQLADEGAKKAWKKGLTQNAPPRPQNSDSSKKH